MAYYYPTGTVLPPQAVNEKPGIYGAYNGAVPGALPTRPGIQLVPQPGMPPGVQTAGMAPAGQPGLPPGIPPGLSPARPPSSPGMPQPPHQGPPGAPQPPMGIGNAAPLPAASSAGYGAATMQPNPYVGSAAAAGLYQGANLAYPQHSISPVAPGPPQPQPTTYLGGRSVSLYAGSRMPAPLPASTYPGTVAYTVSNMPPLVYPGGAPPAAFSAPGPTYTYTVGSAQSIPGESIPGMPSQLQQPLASTGIPAYAAPAAAPPPSYPPQPVQAGQPIPGGMPLMASHPYPAGAVPQFQRSMP